MCNTCRHSLGTIQSYMAWNFLPSYLVYILYCVWKVKASKAQAGFRLMLFYKSEINFRLQFEFLIKERRNSTVHHITVSSFLYNWWNIKKPYQFDLVSYWYELLLHDCIKSDLMAYIVPCHIMNILWTNIWYESNEINLIHAHCLIPEWKQYSLVYMISTAHYICSIPLEIIQ